MPNCKDPKEQKCRLSLTNRNFENPTSSERYLEMLYIYLVNDIQNYLLKSKSYLFSELWRRNVSISSDNFDTLDTKQTHLGNALRGIGVGIWYHQPSNQLHNMQSKMQSRMHHPKSKIQDGRCNQHGITGRRCRRKDRTV